MHPFIFKLGALKLSSYGLMLGIAFLTGMTFAKKRAAREGLDPNKIESLSVWLIIAGVVGARILYTFVEHADEYWRNPFQFFAFHKGGLSFYGGFFLAVGTAVWFCKKHRMAFWQVADIFAPMIALGLAIAKIGCFLAGCCHGKVCDLPWAITFTHIESLAEPRGVPLHPAQIYESLATLAIFLGLTAFRRFKKFDGEIFLLFLIIYGVTRSALEMLRGSPGHLMGLTTAQFLSIPMVGAAVLWWILRKRK
jgi:phosphatidylglycerol:prolipoprotein diacylglycerol transferase